MGNQKHYHALVDMGRLGERLGFFYLCTSNLWAFSNGIRFSISDLSSPTARILPSIYQERCDISLYDAQYLDDARVPIPQTIMNEVVEALLRFQAISDDFEVYREHFKIIATEATRTALNSEDFLNLVQEKTNVKVNMLPKEQEGQIGALGIASSFERIEGLLMDLGGGSIQITWAESVKGEIMMSPCGSVSLPYGAAALTRELNNLNSSAEKDQLQQKLIGAIVQALERLEISETLRGYSSSDNGLQIFLSGGGFRGWGYVLMSAHRIQPYPIPIINGFSVSSHEFMPASVPRLSELDSSTFRISSRRASQIPAITCLISALTAVLSPTIDRARFHFAQGGLREGWLFSLLSPSVRASSPLVAATSPYAALSAASIVSLVESALASDAPSPLDWSFENLDTLLRSAVNIMYIHASCPKDVRAASALHSTTTGLLAGAHGISHTDRALLGLVLFERWRGELPPIDVQLHLGLQQIVGSASSFLAAYLGRILYGLGDVFPAGRVRDGALAISTAWGAVEGGKRHGEPVLRLELLADELALSAVERWAVDLEKLGKKKNWVRTSRDPTARGFKIDCVVRSSAVSLAS